MSFDLRIKIPHQWTRTVVKAKLEYAFDKHPEWKQFVTKFKVIGYRADFTINVVGYVCTGSLEVEDEHILYTLRDIPIVAFPLKVFFIKELERIAQGILK